jgi:hypothetical protein
LSDDIRQRIKELEQLALVAYNCRDFKAEDKYDSEARKLRATLENQVPDKLLTVADLTPHAWDTAAIALCGDARCDVCGQKNSYYNEGIRTVMSWPESEKKTQRFNNALLVFSCVPHTGAKNE